jgi:enoyl-[acyl-carrier protein] reductase/trans-2-enoyl-CoA reductase (NAD+)
VNIPTPNAVSQVSIPAATEDEVFQTIKVMGGEDWKDWITALNDANLLADNTITLAYSYLGPELTHPIYLKGSIGMAKKHLYDTAAQMTSEFPNVKAYISVNKALVTQSSAAIPIVPLYITLIYKVMKAEGTHENCIQQMYRLYHDKLFVAKPELDEEGRFRVDDWEMRDEIQQTVVKTWLTLNNDTVQQACDIEGYWEDFYQMFGFNMPGVDYTQDIEIDVAIPSIKE